MGKVRVASFGDAEAEKKQERLKQRRADAKEAKKAETEKKSDDAQAPVQDTMSIEAEAKTEDAKPAQKPQKKEKFAHTKTKHSKSYQAVATEVDKNKIYDLKEALTILPKLKRAKFDETVELHLNTVDKGISGSVVLPHGTGKQIRVAIATDAIIAEIEKGQINFDILIAEPSMMPKLAKVARVLGPRGLMPNPKNGTVTPKPEEAAKKYEGGQVNFKTEAKFPLLHITIGKVSFGDQKLSDNIKTFIGAIEKNKIKNATLKSTMSPGIRLDVTSI